LKNHRLTWLLLLLAFLLRFPGIFDGLPAAYNSTEYFLAKTALGMGARHSLDPLVYIYPTLYAYFLLFLYVVLYLAGSLAGIFHNSIDFAVRFLVDPSAFYLAGRITSVLFSVLTVYIFYSQTRKIFGEISARFAAVAAAVSYYFVFYSRFAVADTMLIFFSTLATLGMIKTYHNPSLKNYAWAGLFTGLAIGTKYNAGFLILGLFVTFILNQIENKHEKSWKAGMLLATSFLVGFFVFNPLWIFKFSDYYNGFRLVSAQMRSAVSLYYGTNYVWEFGQIITHELIIGLGFFIAITVFVVRRKPVHLILLLPVLVTFIYVGSWQKKGIDYLLAVFPAWILMFSLWLEEFYLKLENKRELRISLILVIFLPSFFINIYQNVLTMRQDTREQATEWVKKNVNQNQKIAYDNYTFDLGLFDVHRYTDYGAGAAQLPAAVKREVRHYINHSRNVSNVPILISAEKENENYDNPYEAQSAQYQRKSISELQDDGVTYLITNSWFYGSYMECNLEEFNPVMRKSITEVRTFYQNVEKTARKVKIFQPNFWRPGPLIRIYDISKKN
jgi:hypothetical protein